MEVGKSGGNTPKKGLQDRFGAGMFFGMILGVLLIVPMYYAIYKLETERDPVAMKHPNYILNSPEWKIDTIKTVVNGKDTIDYMQFVPNK